MSSKNKTPNIGLNKWQGNEYAKREDFVNDNLIIDQEIKDLKTKTEEVKQSAKNYTDTEVSKKVDKISGKGLSTEDYTSTDKNKLAGIQVGANKYSHPNTHSANIIVQNSERRFVSDSEKANWNNAVQHISNTIKHITQAEREKWNTVTNKVDKVSGKGLSTNDYTTAEKNKLNGIQSGAQVNRPISDSVSSSSTSTAASSKAVKAAYDRAVTALNTANTKETAFSKNTGFNLNKSDSVTSTSTSTLATSKAVKSAYDRATTALNTANAKEPKITKKTGFNLNKSDSATSASTSTLATSKAVKTAYDKGNDAYRKVTSATYVRDRIKTVDGTGSGIDADLLDGKHATSFLQKTEVQYISNFGVPLKTLSIGVSNIYGVDVDDNYIYCTTKVDRGRLYRISKNTGNAISSFQVAKKDDRLHGIAIEGDNVWIGVDYSMWKSTKTGSPSNAFSGGTNLKRSVCVDGSYLWFIGQWSDDYNVYKSSKSGGIVSSFSFPNATGIAIDNNYLYIQTTVGDICKCDKSGKIIQKFHTNVSGTDICLRNNIFYVVDSQLNKIKCFGNDGNILIQT